MTFGGGLPPQIKECVIKYQKELDAHHKIFLGLGDREGGGGGEGEGGQRGGAVERGDQIEEVITH